MRQVGDSEYPDRGARPPNLNIADRHGPLRVHLFVANSCLPVWLTGRRVVSQKRETEMDGTAAGATFASDDLVNGRSAE